MSPAGSPLTDSCQHLISVNLEGGQHVRDVRHVERGPDERDPFGWGSGARLGHVSGVGPRNGKLGKINCM